MPTSDGSARSARPWNGSIACGSSFPRRPARSSLRSLLLPAGASSASRSRLPPMPEIVARPVDAQVAERLAASGCDPRLARIFAARGLASTDELATTLKSLVAPEALLHVDDA